MTTAKIKELWKYPIKGLTPQKWEQLLLTQGQGIKGDRAFALMFLDREKEGENPIPFSELQNIPWLSKKHFAVQNDWPALAALDCNYHTETQKLQVKFQENLLLEANPNDPQERQRIGEFFSRYLRDLDPTETARHPLKNPLVLVGNSEGNCSYPDREAFHLSLLSQETLNHLSQLTGKEIDSRRFRANVILENVRAWEEFEWVGKTVLLGEAKLLISARINRCVNIEVNPETGQRDLPLLRVLQQNFSHKQTGVLATIIQGGSVQTGDQLIIESSP